MPSRITRIGVYAYPPAPLRTAITRTWRGDFPEDRACELVARHAGECPLWDAHITLLDAVSIIESDRNAFAAAIRSVIEEEFPLTLTGPDIKEWGWGDNVFLRWTADAGRERLEGLRGRLADVADEFVVTERVDWEKVNDLERLVRASDPGRPGPFAEALERFKQLMTSEQIELPYAPNIPLERYIEKLALGGPLEPRRPPFALAPHISIATGVTADETYGWSAGQVGDYVKKHLRTSAHFLGLLGPALKHTLTNAYIVGPASPSETLEITVLDRIANVSRKERRQPWKQQQPALLPEGNTQESVLASDVVFAFWTRWPWPSGADTSDDAASALADAVVSACWRFAVESLEGGEAGLIYLLKTTGKGVNDPVRVKKEEEIWRAAVVNLQSRHPECRTRFEFQYVGGVPPVCSAWDMCWNLSRWWEYGKVLAFPAMDYVDALLEDDAHRITSYNALGEHVQSRLRHAPRAFRQLLRETAAHRGLTIGGYETIELDAAPQPRRGGLAAKDLLEAAFRCCAAGMFHDFAPLQGLLQSYPDLRVRSEILGIHRDCWDKLRRAGRLRIEPWEATFQLIVGALAEGCHVTQVDFGFLLEEGKGKPDSAVLEQTRRGLHLLDRLLHTERLPGGCLSSDNRHIERRG